MLLQAAVRERNSVLLQQAQFAMPQPSQLLSGAGHSNAIFMEALNNMNASRTLHASSATGQQSQLTAPASSVTTATPLTLPVLIAIPEDDSKLSSHQVFLRQQIEAFKAGDDDVSTHTRYDMGCIRFCRIVSVPCFVKKVLTLFRLSQLLEGETSLLRMDKV
jgi:hypothetical protein